MAAASSSASRPEKTFFLTISDDEDDGRRPISGKPIPTVPRGRVLSPMKTRTSTRQPSPSSSTPQTMVFCKICMETVTVSDSFTTGPCSHVFCSECVSQHIIAKVGESSAAVTCPEPNCPSILDSELCQFIIPWDVFLRWGKMLCEAAIGEPLKFYCPYKDCSVLLLDDRVVGEQVVIQEAECPHCHRLFCAQCRTPWHSDIGCDEFQKLGKHEREKEDIMLMNLAKAKKWGRCSKCGFYVEKTTGCSYVVCRCKHPFCYFCGALRPVHDAICTKCKR